MSGIDVWTFYESLQEAGREGLSARQVAVAAICDLRQEVNSGGFDRYFRYWGGNSAQAALVALPRALGSDDHDPRRGGRRLCVADGGMRAGRSR